MNRLIKTELVNARINQCFKTAIYREINKSSELASIKAKELSVNISNEELQELKDPNYSKSTESDQFKSKNRSKYNLKYKLPRIELKHDKWEDSSSYNQLFESNLRSFLYACINTNQDKDVFKSVEFYQNNKSSLIRLGQAPSLKILNILVKNYALKDNLDGIEHCRNLIANINYKPDLVFYSYLLFALAKNGHHNEMINLINSIQQKNDLNLNNLFENTYLNSEQRTFLNKTLLECGYKFNLNVSKGQEYNSKLLDNYQKIARAKFSPLKDIQFNEELFNEQLRNERNIYVKMKSAYVGIENEFNNSIVDEITKEWNHKLKQAFNNNLNLMKTQNLDDYRINIYPFLNSFNRDKLTKFLVTYIIEMTKFKYPSGNNFLSSQIGNLLENQYLSMIKLKHVKNLKSIYRTYFEQISDENKFSEANSRLICRKMFFDLDLFNKELNEMVWSGKIKRDVGNYALQTCLETLRFNYNLLKPKSKGKHKTLPAFFKTTQFENGKRNDLITVNNALNKITSNMTNYSLMSARDLPMLVPPFPWNSAEGFPFLIAKLFLVIEPSIIYERKIAEKIRNFNINAVLDSLNYTSLTPWKINEDVLKIVNQIFQNGGDYKLDIPHHHTKMPEIPRKEPDEDIKMYRKRTYQAKKQNREMYSLWCEMNYKLSIANYVSFI